jgi:hypothetical protein
VKRLVCCKGWAISHASFRLFTKAP